MTKESKEGLLALANNCGDMANSIYAASEQSSQYIKQSITDTAACASNIQIVGNATLRLSGDIGNIYNILNTVEQHKDIWLAGNDAREKGEKVGYKAEVLAQKGMDASILTSEVSVVNVVNLAREISDLMSHLVNGINLGFENASINTDSFESLSFSENAFDEVTAKGTEADGTSQLDKCQTLVDLYSVKSAHILDLLEKADGKQDQANSEKILVEEIIQKTLSLQSSIGVVLREMKKADEMAKEVATGIQKFGSRLVGFVEIINKLNSLIVREKALDPTVPEELINLSNTSVHDAINAVSLTSVAIKSTLVMISANVASLASLSLLNTQSELLLEKLAGDEFESESEIAPCLQFHLKKICHEAVANYDRINEQYFVVINQLNIANENLAKAKHT